MLTNDYIPQTARPLKIEKLIVAKASKKGSDLFLIDTYNFYHKNSAGIHNETQILNLHGG